MYLISQMLPIDASNGTHPLLFLEGVDGLTPYSDGVTTTGTP